MCDDCREDVGDEIYDGVEAFLADYPDAEFGPAHIVMSDLNIEPDGHVRWCCALIAMEQQRRGLRQDNPDDDTLTERDREHFGQGFYADCDTDELAATYSFLREWLLPKARVWSESQSAQ